MSILSQARLWRVLCLVGRSGFGSALKKRTRLFLARSFMNSFGRYQQFAQGLLLCSFYYL